jgi:hypothetical protein
MLRCAIRAVVARAAHRAQQGRLAPHRIGTSQKPAPSGAAWATSKPVSASEPVATIFSTLFTSFGGIAVVGVLATSMRADLLEVRNSLHLYCLDIARAALCWPSDLVFVALMAPSQYECDLRNLKVVLAEDSKELPPTPTATSAPTTTMLAPTATSTPITTTLAPTPPTLWLADKLRDFKCRYGEFRTSDRFEDVLDYMLACRPGSSVRRCDEPGKYMSYLRACVDWELIHVQPMRYIGNETEKAQYALLFTVCAANTFALLAERAAASTFSMLDVVKSVHQPGFGFAAAIAGGSVLRIVNVLRRLTPMFVWVNTLNLVFQFGTYKKGVQQPAELAS